MAISRLVLGFDAGCLACSKIAQDVLEATGGKLEVMSLSAPEMVTWRVSALGPDAPWTPTLVGVTGEKVTAKTGVAMGMTMIRQLGIQGSWKILQKLGELRQESASSDRGPERGLSRNFFLKSAAGAGLGLTILVGSGASAATAGNRKRNSHWFDQLSGKSKADLTEKEALAAWKESAGSEHMARLRHLGSMASESKVMFSDSVQGIEVSVEAPDRPAVKGVRHALSDGGAMVAVSYINGETVIATYTVTSASGTTRRLTRVYEVTGTETSRLVAEADDGVATDLKLRSDDQVSPMAGDCPDCMSRRCDEQNWGCVQSCCYGCAFACGVLASCIACAVIGCPWCVSLNCCNRSSCYPIVRCGPY